MLKKQIGKEKTMETTVYLIRHSVRLNMKNNIESYNTTQENLIKSEKIILSVTGERRAEKAKQRKRTTKHRCSIRKQLCKNIADSKILNGKTKS